MATYNMRDNTQNQKKCQCIFYTLYNMPNGQTWPLITNFKTGRLSNSRELHEK